MKQAFLDALLADLPEGVLNFLSTPFGEIDEIEIPNDEASAKIACGKLAANLNNAFLRPFSGFTPAEALMRIGSKNAVHISAMLSGLEVIAGSGGKLTPIAPINGGVYENYFEIQAQGSGLESVALRIGEDSMSLTESDGLWTGQPMIPFSTGKHSGVFLGVFQDGNDIQIPVEFETTANMELVATFPENETTIQPEELTQISATLSDDAATSNQAVNVSIFGQTLTLQREESNTYRKDLAEVDVSLLDWLGLNVMLVSYESADGTKNEEIRFVLGDTDGGGE